MAVESALPVAALAGRGSTASRFRAADGHFRWLRESRRLHVILFAALIVISLVPVMLLGTWVERSAMEQELASVTEKHLLIARNLGGTLARYVGDVRDGFGAAIEMAQTGETTPSMSRFLLSLGFSHVCIVDGDGRIERSLIPDTETLKRLPPGPDVMPTLRQIAVDAGGAVVLTDLLDDGGRPRFFAVESLGHGRIAIGVLGIDYIRSVQRAVSFGDRGHSMIVDGQGRVVAHPKEEWETNGVNVSRLPPVARMLRGESGVMRFWSPPMRADMIAGFATVPGIGWGVMVPQPISELEARASEAQFIAAIVSLVGVLVAALLSWWLAKYLARPIVAIERAAGAVAAGGLDTQVDPLPRHAPRELHRLAASFNTMVTELSEREDGLRIAMREAESANRAKTEFLANMSHELRTPLNGILGFTDILRRQMFGGLSARYLEYSNDIYKAGSHLLDAINDLLDMAKVESNQLVKQEVAVDLDHMIPSCISLVEARARQGGVGVGYNVPDGFPYLRADKRMMKQIVLNLLSNAIKFTPEDGMVHVAVSRDDDGDCLIEVVDTGIGIAPDQIELVMKPFYQVDTRMQRKFEGTGLGLPLVRAMVVAQGGVMHLQSTPDMGTRVTVRFPATLLTDRAPDA